MNITKMEEFMRENDLMIIERCIENKNEKLDVKEEPFEKLMFFYKSALKQLELQMNIIKDTEGCCQQTVSPKRVTKITASFGREGGYFCLL